MAFITVVVASVTLFFLVTTVLPSLRGARGRGGLDATPDTPVSFGYGMGWLAIRTEESEHVRDALGLEGVEPANWRSGIAAVYDESAGPARVFVSPPVGGWTFVVSLALPLPMGPAFEDRTTPLLHALADAFSEVQYYFTDPLIGHFAWARIVDGRILRAFAWGDEGVVWNRGALSRAERAMGLSLTELRSVGPGGRVARRIEPKMAITEDQVLSLAGRWSIDPSRLEGALAEPAVGYVGPAPAAWRPRRKRR